MIPPNLMLDIRRMSITGNFIKKEKDCVNGGLNRCITLKEFLKEIPPWMRHEYFKFRVKEI